jgi:hypothetical protein
MMINRPGFSPLTPGPDRTGSGAFFLQGDVNIFNQAFAACPEQDSNFSLLSLSGQQTGFMERPFKIGVAKSHVPNRLISHRLIRFFPYSLNPASGMARPLQST